MSECDSSSRRRASRDNVSQLRITRALLIALVLITPGTPATTSAHVPDDHPFRFDGTLAQRASLTHTVDLVDPAGVPDASMAQTLSGVLASLDSRDIRRLERAIAQAPESDGELLDERDVAWLHVFHNDQARTFAIRDVGDERHLRAVRDDLPEVSFGINRRTLEPLLATAPIYRGSFQPVPFDLPPQPGQRSAVLLPPYETSPVTFNQATMKLRLYHGMNLVNPDADRDLAHATIRVRESKDYDPRNPAGLLVWASPTPSGEIPHVITQPADALGFICVGVDDAGNEQSNQNKFELIFDALHNAQRQFHIDPDRIYITGLSGGGKVASILTICFPDVFHGAIPIAGLATHATLSMAFDDHRYPYFALPRGEMLMTAQQRPIASITGPRDFNYVEMKERSRRLETEGFKHAKFFEFDGLGHEMPTPEQFEQVLRFVDEPYQRSRAERIAQAKAANPPRCAMALLHL